MYYDIFITIVIIFVIGVAAGWIGFGVYKLVVHYKAKNQPEEKPEETTEHLKKVKDSFEDYTRKLASFKRKTYKREDLQ